MQMNKKIDDNWRKNVIETAWNFVNIIWIPTKKNIYHGYDLNGVLVNTPDINYSGVKYNKCGWWHIGKQNQGMAYNWGGLCTVEEFQKGISEGKYAGNVPDSRDNKISRQCIGVDCSGLVSACWGIEKKQSTKSLLSFARKLDTTDDMLFGDVFLLPGNHVMIFIEFTDNKKSSARIIHATRSTGKVLSEIVQVAGLIGKGYAGYCYDEK